MVGTQRGEGRRAGGTGDKLGEAVRLVRDYAKQETVDPLRNLGRFVALGSLGSITFGIGVTLVLVGILRAVQTETDTALTGSWSWVPYLVTLVVAGLATLWSLRAIKRQRRAQ